MKNIISILIILTSFTMSAQKCNELFYPKYSLQQINEHEISSFLKGYFQDLRSYDIQLQLTFERKTNHTQHFTFDILYKQIALLHSCIKVNTDLEGNMISIKKENFDLATLSNLNTDFEINQWNKINIQQYAYQYWTSRKIIKSQGYKIFLINENPCVVLELNTWSKTHDNTLVIDIAGNKLFEYDHALHVNIDTMVQVKIFNPDPLTTASQNYGGIYIDNSDANDTWMNAQYQTVNVNGTFDNSNNTFYLENQYVAIDDIEGPMVPVPTSSTPSFLYDRSQPGFEFANAFYHITHFHDYISSIGYDTLMDMQLLVDAHGQFGADNSVFNKNGGNPNIIYGIGGVDDAEDADVIIHEYSHALSWSANNNSSTGFDRMGLDEGLGDYFATSYSRAINPFNWQNVFSWDGPVWGGRTANTTDNYPNTTSIYKVGEIWNCAMSAIWTDLGNIVTDKLMLEAMHFFTNTTTLPEAAIYILQADTILFGGIHSTTICNHFKNKNILNANCKPVGIQPIEQSKAINISNTLAFATNEGDAIVQFSKSNSGTYSLYDVSGKLIRIISFDNANKLFVSPHTIGSGLYLLHIKTNEGEKVFKLNRL